MRSKPCLAVFLRNAEVGMWLVRTADGWRLDGLADGGGRERVNVTTDPATGEARCSCAARRRTCKHLSALAAVGLLDAAAVPC
jgi:uncharacterized Zn finger protein